MVSDKEYNVISMTGASTSLIFIITFSIYDLTKRYKNKSSDQDFSHSSSTSLFSWRNAQTLFSHLIILCYGLQMAAMLFRDLHYLILLSCEACARIVGTIWCFSKASLWAVLIIRLQVSFSRSTYAYSTKKVIVPLLSYILLYLSVAVTIAMITTEGFNVNNNDNDDNHIRCAWKYPPWGIGLTIASDMFMSLLCLFLFIRPLVMLANQMKEMMSGRPKRKQENNNKKDKDGKGENKDGKHGKKSSKGSKGGGNLNDHSDPKMIFLIKKYVILVSIAVATTFMALIVTFLDSSNVVQALFVNICFYVDASINVACVILMNAVHTELYIKLCSRCDRCINVDIITAPLHVQSHSSDTPKIANGA